MADPQSFVQQKINDYLSKTGAPGVAATFVANGQAGYAFAGNGIDGDDTTAVNEDMLFGLGSVSKVFTATLLAVQKELGNLQLSDPVTNYLPKAVSAKGGAIKNVTLLDLATHTSSMPDELAGQPSFYAFNEQPPAAWIVDWWNQWTPAFPIGTAWQYSNIGFVTLAFAVTGPGKNQYNQFLSEQLTGPLGMSRTAAYIAAPGGAVAQGYVGPPGVNNRVWSQADDLKSTAADMQRFLLASLGLNSSAPQVLQNAILDTHQQQNALPVHGKDHSMRMGLAWQLYNDDQGNTLLEKDGATGLGGFCAWVGLAPALKNAVAVLVNKDGSSHITELGRALLKGLS